jgi:hypothetical protein
MQLFRGGCGYSHGPERFQERLHRRWINSVPAHEAVLEGRLDRGQ